MVILAFVLGGVVFLLIDKAIDLISSRFRSSRFGDSRFGVKHNADEEDARLATIMLVGGSALFCLVSVYFN